PRGSFPIFEPTIFGHFASRCRGKWRSTMATTFSSRWFFLCAVPVTACGHAPLDGTDPVRAGLSGESTGIATCAFAAENGTATIACPAGQTIATVSFASYGTPTGSCGALSEGACAAPSSLAVVTKACAGKTTCAVPASNGTFGDPCVGTVK